MKKKAARILKEVATLPSDALSVKNYCAKKEISSTTFYNWLQRRDKDFEIVLFQGKQFITEQQT